MELLAPTARAAKNIAKKTGFPAQTIHSLIYRVDSDLEQGVVRFTPKSNLEPEFTVFIVDESSMIGDRASHSGGDFVSPQKLLGDLVRFIKGGNTRSKVIFVGDECQLPPVGYTNVEYSPAMDLGYLQREYKLKGSVVELTEIVRQQSGSYILEAALQVRKYVIGRDKTAFGSSLGKKMFSCNDAVRLYLGNYNPKDHDSVVILSMSNSYLQKCNSLIRAELGLQGELATGDRITLIQNFYCKRGAYVANGEMGVVKTIGQTCKVAGLNFREVEVEFRSIDGEAYLVQAKLLSDALSNPKVLTREKKQELFAYAYRTNAAFRQSKQVWDDEYLSAMMVGYGHAFTCHKAQGSEWDTVLFNTWMPKDAPDNRFLYTGITRARRDLYTNEAHLFA